MMHDNYKMVVHKHKEFILEDRKVKVVRASDGNSHWQLAEKFCIISSIYTV